LLSLPTYVTVVMARTEDDSIEISSLIINNGTSGPYAPPSSFPNKVKRPQSPFFRPSTPQRIIVTETISTPNGTRTITVQKKRLVSSGRIDEENKSSIIGAFSNLVNAIVGAGIIGIPYAMKECGLGAGLVLIFFVALLTDKSLRLLIETGKHAQVQSYETLMEAAFGRKGFIFISINMLIMSYGAMVAYLLVIKDTVPFALGIDPDDEGMKRAILLISSISILLPLSCQRDIADLSKTSSISVMFDILLVGIIVISAPIRSAVEASGGLKQVLLQSIVHKSTLFVGLGVLSFAFVCQDSSFIIAGSLRHPTKKRWNIVTKSTLLTSSFLSTFIGCAGYLGFQEETEGNILNSFIDYPPSGKIFGMVDASSTVNIARGLLGLTMFFVYVSAPNSCIRISFLLLPYLTKHDSNFYAADVFICGAPCYDCTSIFRQTRS
jgi:solute carrier family 38 (sodium-coupled neutral amino acid transporter), member 11